MANDLISTFFSHGALRVALRLENGRTLPTGLEIPAQLSFEQPIPLLSGREGFRELGASSVETPVLFRSRGLFKN